MPRRLTAVFTIAIASLLAAPGAAGEPSALDRALDDADALLVRWAESGDEKRRAFAAREALTLQSARWTEISARVATDRFPQVRSAWFETSLVLSPQATGIRDEAMRRLASPDMRDAQLFRYRQWPWAPIERDELESLLPGDDEYSAELTEVLCNGNALGGSVAPVVARLATSTSGSRAAEQLRNCAAELEVLAAPPPDTPQGRAELRSLWKSPEGYIDLKIAKQLAHRRDPEFIRDFDSWLRRARYFTEPMWRELEQSNLVLQLAPDLSPEAVREVTLRSGDQYLVQTMTSMMLWRRMGIRSDGALVRALESRKSPAAQLFIAGVLLGDERLIDKGMAAGVNIAELRGTDDVLAPFTRALAPAVRGRIASALLERIPRAAHYGEEGLKLLGIFCEGSCFDEVWLRFRAGGEEGRNRSAWLAVLVSSFDPRGSALRQQFSKSGIREAARLVKRGAPARVVTLDSIAATGGPATFFSLLEGSGRSGNVRLTGLRMLFESELSSSARDVLRASTAAALNAVLVSRAVNRDGEPNVDSAWRELTTLLESRGMTDTMRWSGRVASEHNGGLTRSGLYWLFESIPAVPPEPPPVPITAEMSADVDAWVASIREHDFATLREGLRKPVDGYDGHGTYRPPRRGAELSDEGYESMAHLDDAHLVRLLEDHDMEVRHQAAALVWIGLRDPRGPEQLVRDAGSLDVAVRTSALMHLAAIEWKPAAGAFEAALGSGDPRLRAVGIAGVERLPIERLFGRASLLVLDPDPRVAEMATAFLGATRAPGFWRILVELVPTRAGRAASYFLPSVGDPLMPEVLDSLESSLRRGLTPGELAYLARLVTQATYWHHDAFYGLDPHEQITLLRSAVDAPNHDLFLRAVIDEAFERSEDGTADEVYALEQLLGMANQGGLSHAAATRWWSSVRGRGLFSIWAEEAVRELSEAPSDRIVMPQMMLDGVPRCEVAQTLVAMLWRAQPGQLSPIRATLVALAGEDLGDPMRGSLAARLEALNAWQGWSESVR